MCVPTSGPNLEDPVVNGEEGDVEGSSPKVKNQYVLLPVLFIKPVRNSRGCGFVYHTLYFEARNLPRVLGGLPLGIVEVGRDGDDCVVDGGTEEGLRSFLHLPQHHSADLLRAHVLHLALYLNPNIGLALFILRHLKREKFLIPLNAGVIKLPPNQPLHVKHCVTRIGGRLVLSSITNKPSALRFAPAHVARRDPVPLLVSANFNPPIPPYPNARVCRAKVYANARTVYLVCIIIGGRIGGGTSTKSVEGVGKIITLR
mmetsp:Transcript_12813/g.26142  ORF Transcript_12813/g.26142 Transcript_12813/m.26142 type:complete len:258 (-) Transcript_12813:62-835(-)